MSDPLQLSSIASPRGTEFQLTGQIFDLPFLQAHRALRLQDAEPCLLLSVTPDLSLPAVAEEVNLWLSAGEFPFWPVLEKWQDDEKIFLAAANLDGVSISSLLNMSPKPLTEEKVFAFLPDLTRIFRAMFEMQIALPPAKALPERIFYFVDGKIRMAPSLISIIFDPKKNLPEPAARNAKRMLATAYTQALGSFLCLLLTREFPSGDIPPKEAKDFLREDLVRFLHSMLLGEIKSFEAIEPFLKPLREARAEVPAPPPVEAPRPPKRKRKRRAKPETAKAKKVQPGPIRRLSLVQILFFSRQLAILLASGIPLATSLELLSRQEQNANVHRLISDLKSRTESGYSFSASLAATKGIFPAYYIAMVEAGEAGGMMVEVLERIGSFLDREISLIKRVKGAMTYPGLMLGTALLIVIGIVKYVFPSFLSLFQGLHLPLPFVTRLIIFFVLILQNPVTWILLPLLAFALIYGFKMYSKAEEAREWLDAFKLKIPVFGNIYKKVAAGRFCRTLVSLYSNGIPIISSLALTADVIGNSVYRKEIQNAVEGLVAGRSMAEAFKEGKVFPPEVVQMVALGEATGELTHALNKISDFYDLAVEHAIEQFSALLEPAIIMLLGLIMGTFMVAIFLPLYHAMSKIGG